MINLRSWIVEGDSVDHVLMAFESKKLRSTVNVPNFTSSVVATCQASINQMNNVLIAYFVSINYLMHNIYLFLMSLLHLLNGF